jgi:hypothetical protein
MLARTMPPAATRFPSRAIATVSKLNVEKVVYEPSRSMAKPGRSHHAPTGAFGGEHHHDPDEERPARVDDQRSDREAAEPL